MSVLSYLDAPASTRIPMTEDQSLLFAECVLAEANKPDFLFTEKQAALLGPIGEIFYHRLQVAGPVEITMPLALFLCFMSDGIPGEAVMWAYTMNRMYLRKGSLSMLTIGDLSNAFPWGFPDENERHRLWDAQKGHEHGENCDNMVDQKLTWEL